MWFYSLRRLPIALVYRSTADLYLPDLKATFPSSLVFSAIVKVSCGSGLGEYGGGVGGGDLIGGGVVVGGVSNKSEPDPDAWLTQK